MKNNKKSSFLTPNQAARVLNVSLSTLKKFIYSGQIKTLRTPGGHHRIRKSDLFEIIDRHPAPARQDVNEDKNLFEISKGMAKLLEKKQKFCRGHADSVAETSLKIGRKLNFSSRKLDKLRLAALFHDIGMLGIKESILNKETVLSSEEYSIIKTHPLLGEEAVNSISRSEKLSKIVRQHHERYDGRGYPDGLKENEICPEAKIITLAEAFASMTAKDSYKSPLSEQKAVEEIKTNSGRQFDPEVVEAFLEFRE